MKTDTTPKNPENAEAPAQTNLVDQAIELAGGVVALQKQLGLPYQSTVSNWKARGAIPVEHMASVEKATRRQVTREMLRPKDWRLIWPELARRRRRGEK